MNSSFRAVHFLAVWWLALVTGYAGPPVIRSAADGPWSSPGTWQDGHVPGAGEIVLIRPGHTVVYDVASEVELRAVHVAGNLVFSREKDTLLCAALIRIAPGEDCQEEGFDCHAPVIEGGKESIRPTLEIGTADAPMPPDHRAIIRLTYLDGMDAQSFPALVCCGGRLDLHGAPMNRTWVKLGEPAGMNSREIVFAEPVTGWKPGDHLLFPTTEMSEFYTQDQNGRRVIGPVMAETQTEEGEIAQVSGTQLLLKQPLKFKHQAEGEFRGEVANLSRNVIVESANPNGARGHTMYHRQSAGSLSYVEFRHLGKEGVLGRYPIHFHECGDSIRGSSVIGVSIWDSRNRWLTIHGTNYLVVRDCVGYRSIGHGFFFENGTEVSNVLDRNLAVQALMGKPLPAQMLPFDTNDAAGFWWANCLNSFTRNVSVESEKHGYRFQMTKTADFDPKLLVRQPDGSSKKVDVRTLPFIRFEGNEAHSQRRFAFNLGGFHGQSTTEDLDRDGNVLDRMGYLGGDVQGVGPEARHPFQIKDFLVWRSHWGFHTAAPNVLIDGLTAYDINYVFWRSNIAGHNYNRMNFREIHVSTFFNNWGAGNERSDFLRFADPVDTLPPVSIITGVQWQADDRVKVTGVTADDSPVREVRVNGQTASLSAGPVFDWTAIVPANGRELTVTAVATDAAANREITPHRLTAIRPARIIAPEVSEPAQAKPMNSAAMLAKAPVAEEVRESAVDARPLKWPLWDGRESIADYAKRTGLPAVQVLVLNGEALELRLIPAGSFLMGSPATEASRAVDESPRHRVVLSQPYYLGKFEVTQAQYERVTGSNPSQFQGKDRPVEQVNWHDAQAFLQKAGHGLRLPTEAEWEFACRAGTDTAYSTGNSEDDARLAGWLGDNDEVDRALSHGQSHAVGGKAANAFGLFDLHGNVYEWCADWYAPDYYRNSPVLDPQGPAAGDQRVLRGGSWEAPMASARSANRNGFSPNSRGYAVGFRVALPVASADAH